MSPTAGLDKELALPNMSFPPGYTTPPQTITTFAILVTILLASGGCP